MYERIAWKIVDKLQYQSDGISVGEYISIGKYIAAGISLATEYQQEDIQYMKLINWNNFLHYEQSYYE